MSQKTDNVLNLMVLRGQILELIEAIGSKDKQKSPEVIRLSVDVVHGAALFLNVSQNGFAALLGVNDTKAVRLWFAGKDTPRKSALLLIQRLVGEIVLPPDSLSPDIGVRSCFEAIGTLLDDMEAKATAAGWQEAEIGEAMRDWLQDRKI